VITVDFSVLTFGQIENANERDRFNNMPTTFQLNPDQVDLLIAEPTRMLQNSPEFQSFLHRLTEP